MKFKEISRALSLGAKVARPQFKDNAHITFDPTNSTFMFHADTMESKPFRNVMGEMAMADAVQADDWYILEGALFKTPKELFDHYAALEKQQND